MFSSLFMRLACGLALVAAPLAVPSSVQAAGPDPVVVFAAGDSITQGRDGDYTWRYLLWKKFKEAGDPIDFVGSRTDTYGGGNHYREPNFDRNHYALAGRTIQQGNDGLAAELKKLPTRPDVVIFEYGTNTLGVHGQSVDDALRDVRAYLKNLRNRLPGVKIVLVEVAVVANEQEFNAGLADIAAGDPLLAVARTRTGWGPDPAATRWDRWVDAWDQTHHPTPAGDAQLTNAIVMALHELGIGDGVPIDEHLTWQPNPPLSVGYSAATRKASISFNSDVADVSNYVIERRAKTLGGAWQPSAVISSGAFGVETWTSPALTVGQEFEFRLVPRRRFMVGHPGGAVRALARNVTVSKTITYDAHGKPRVGVSCANTCTGYLQVWLDKNGTKKSAASKYSVKGGAWKWVYLTGVPKVSTNAAQLRIKQDSKPVVGANPEFQPLTLRAPNVSALPGITYDERGRGSVTVACLQACSGWVQLRENYDTVRSDVAYFTVAAGKTKVVPLTGIVDPESGNTQIRIAQKSPIVAPNPLFLPLDLRQRPLPKPVPPNVVVSSAVAWDKSGGGQIKVTCAVTCDGWLQVWSSADAGTAAKSDPVHYQVAGGLTGKWFELTNVPAVTSTAARLRINQTAPVVGDKIGFRNLRLAEVNTPNVKVSASVTRDPITGRPRIGVQCFRACSGWVQVWGVRQDDAMPTDDQKSRAGRYELAAESWAWIPIDALPTMTATAAVRIYQQRPVVLGNPQFVPVGAPPY